MNALLLFSIFLFISAFFSSTETALTASNRVKVRHLLEKKIKGAKTLDKILQNPRQLISAIVIGNNIFDICVTVIGTEMLNTYLSHAGITSPVLLFTLITLILTFVLLVFGEIIPKSFVIHSPEKFGLVVAPFLIFWMALVSPLVFIFEKMIHFFAKLTGVKTLPMGKLFSAEEVKTAVKIAHEEGVLDQEEQDMIQSIIEFKEKIVREIMTPRTDAVCLPATATKSQAVDLIKSQGHSRIPVYEDRLDNTLGILYAKDLLTRDEAQPDSSIRELLREAVFIPETKSVEDLFHQMQRSKFHMAIVVDEHGGMSGVVTIEDIVEEILGEIRDEYDTDEVPEITRISETHLIVNGAININTLAEELNTPFPEDADYDTLGGFVLSVLGRLPVKGEEITYENLRIKIQEVSKRRIKLLEIWKNPYTEEATSQVSS